GSHSTIRQRKAVALNPDGAGHVFRNGWHQFPDSLSIYQDLMVNTVSCKQVDAVTQRLHVVFGFGYLDLPLSNKPAIVADEIVQFVPQAAGCQRQWHFCQWAAQRAHPACIDPRRMAT